MIQLGDGVAMKKEKVENHNDLELNSWITKNRDCC